MEIGLRPWEGPGVKVSCNRNQLRAFWGSFTNIQPVFYGYLHDSLEGECLFLLVLVSRYDKGIRLSQNLLPGSNREGSVLKREKKEAKKGRRVRCMRNKTVVLGSIGAKNSCGTGLTS